MPVLQCVGWVLKNSGSVRGEILLSVGGQYMLMENLAWGTGVGQQGQGAISAECRCFFFAMAALPSYRFAGSLSRLNMYYVSISHSLPLDRSFRRRLEQGAHASPATSWRHSRRHPWPERQRCVQRRQREMIFRAGFTPSLGPDSRLARRAGNQGTHPRPASWWWACGAQPT